MILYSPLDGDAITSPILSSPRHCFLITRLGNPIPKEVNDMRISISDICNFKNYPVIDASTDITGRDFLLKIWKQIASVPLCIGISHEDIPVKTQNNIYYELGIAQALGKETILIKSINSEIPSDFVRSEYILYDRNFKENLLKYLESVDKQAEHYEFMSEQVENNPILSIDYLRRAFLITGDKNLRKKAKKLLKNSKLNERAKNSVEQLTANF